MQNVRYNISPCSSSEATEFIGKINKSVYLPRGVVNADERSHYDRYTYVREDSKVAVVYDTSANVISITAPAGYADELLELFGPNGRSVKRSLLPAQNVQKRDGQYRTATSVEAYGAADTRAKLFVPPEKIRMRPAAKTTTVIMTAKGVELSTDEIFPPQRAKRRNTADDAHDGAPYNSGYVNKNNTVGYARENMGGYGRDGVHVNASMPERQKAASVDEYFTRNAAPTVTRLKRTDGKPRRAVISFGDEDEENGKTLPERPRSGTGLYADIAAHTATPTQTRDDEQVKRKRGRPRKDTATADIVAPPELREQAYAPQQQVRQSPPLEYKNGYSVKNYPQEKLAAMLKRLKADGYNVKLDETEFGGTPQEVKVYSVSDASGSKVYLRYATKKMTVQLQGRHSELFGEVQSQVSRDSDYSSALENYVGEGSAPQAKVSEIDGRLKKRLPTAYGYLSEQSRIDFSYGLHDFSQNKLMLSDYSVLLVPPFRGLERFIFDLQRAEGIKVKMIGQAFDKDESGRYILKNGYNQRIGSVVYAEVMVALYTEYFSRRNFFAHSDNSEDSRSRAIPDRTVAKGIFDNLLNIVEYNAKKLKEIGFAMSPDDM